MKLLELKQALLESSTVAQGIMKDPKRAEFFFSQIELGKPFPLTDQGAEIVIAKSQLPQLKKLAASKQLDNVKLLATDGEEYSINKLKKTPGLGGKEAETLAVKPTDVFSGEDIDPESKNVLDLLASGGAFPVSELNNKIQNNPALDKVGNIGKAIKEIAQQIASSQEATMPAYLKDSEKKAIELYAGEYLGVLSIFHGVSNFPKRAEFDEFLGTDLGDLMLYFPRSQSNPLADSFAIQNTEDGHSLKISSKAAGKGAAPSLEGLKIPNHVRRNKKFATEVKFFDEAKSDKYSTFTQPFGLMNWLFENMPEYINEAFYPYLPWTQEWIEELKNAVDPKKGIYFQGPIVKDLSATLAKGRPAGSDAGVIWYAVITEVINAVNKKNALPNLKAVVLETLGYNFMQVYTTLSGDKLKTKVFWPAKIDGKVQLKTKGYAGNTNYGKLGFQVSS
jgi:guanyl-specific ribonuclease Sa